MFHGFPSLSWSQNPHSGPEGPTCPSSVSLTSVPLCSFSDTPASLLEEPWPQHHSCSWHFPLSGQPLTLQITVRLTPDLLLVFARVSSSQWCLCWHLIVNFSPLCTHPSSPLLSWRSQPSRGGDWCHHFGTTIDRAASLAFPPGADLPAGWRALALLCPSVLLGEFSGKALPSGSTMGLSLASSVASIQPWV